MRRNCIDTSAARRTYRTRRSNQLVPILLHNLISGTLNDISLDYFLCNSILKACIF